MKGTAIMIKTLLRTGAAAIASAAVLSLATASPAAAGSDWNGCKSGNVCLYGLSLNASSIMYQDPWGVPNGKTFYAIVNNGNPQAGADHVHFEYRPTGSSQAWQSKCLHFLPGSGYILDLRDGPVSQQIRNMYWGGEC